MLNILDKNNDENEKEKLKKQFDEEKKKTLSEKETVEKLKAEIGKLNILIIVIILLYLIVDVYLVSFTIILIISTIKENQVPVFLYAAEHS